VLTFHRLDARWTGGLGGGRLNARVGVGVDDTETPATTTSGSPSTRAG
jgi:hypothetical protein